MTRFFGKVGYVTPTLIRPGVHGEVVKEYAHYGTVDQHTIYLRREDTALGTMSYQTTISIVADPYSLENYANIRFVEHAGVAWVVTSTKPQRPRIVLVLGEVYNGARETP